jgi:hypothetical protein
MISPPMPNNAPTITGAKRATEFADRARAHGSLYLSIEWLRNVSVHAS